MASSKKWFLMLIPVALLAVSAAGIANEADQWPITFTDCDSKFRFKNHEMRIGDLFPEDCEKGASPSAAEGLDVPAIAEQYLAHHKGDPCFSMVAMACIYTADEYEKRFTCADKSRIVMTAENGDNWCHKPQTEVTK